MARIQVLSEALANQIAAGEVVESPASVVKELVENAIDANSRKIEIVIEESGLKSIRIHDDGDGIVADDVPLAFQRHATSKIQTQKDLFKVQTLGFRGEALPSIASVSKLTLITTARGESQGVEITVDAGKISEPKPAAPRQGTTVIVENLFYNTPARLKHVGKLATELSKIVNIVNRLALSHPEIRFLLKKESGVLFQTSGNGDEKQVIAQIYGMNTAKKMIPIQTSDLDFDVKGFVSLPELTRSSKQHISFILNGRYVRNLALDRALIEGYGTKLMVGRHPFAVICVDFDPTLIDVNVHPSKQQVRLSKEESLARLITESIQKALHKETLIPQAEVPGVKKERQPKPEQTVMDLGAPTIDDQVQVGMPAFDASHWANDAVYNQPFEVKSSVEEQTTVYEPKEPDIPLRDDLADYLSTARVQKHGETTRFPHLEYFGQMHGTYLFAQNETGLYIIDQHAAQERIKYEYYRVKIGDIGDEQQQLLMPMTLDVSASDAIRLQEGKEDLEALGLFLEPFGQNSFIIHSHPAWMTESIEQNIQDMLDMYLRDKRLTIAEFREATAIMMSCKRSIKANHHLNDEQARQLLDDLARCENPFNCPHGRPVVIQLTNTELEHMFKRIQDPH